MLKVTQSAKQRLKETLLAATEDKEAGLRLTMKSPGQLGLVLDRELPGDHVVKHGGAKVLLVGPEINELLEETTLDVREAPDGPRLTILQGQ